MGRGPNRCTVLRSRAGYVFARAARAPTGPSVNAPGWRRTPGPTAGRRKFALYLRRNRTDCGRSSVLASARLEYPHHPAPFRPSFRRRVRPDRVRRCRCARDAPSLERSVALYRGPLLEGIPEAWSFRSWESRSACLAEGAGDAWRRGAGAARSRVAIDRSAAVVAMARPASARTRPDGRAGGERDLPAGTQTYRDLPSSPPRRTPSRTQDRRALSTPRRRRPAPAPSDPPSPRPIRTAPAPPFRFSAGSDRARNGYRAVSRTLDGRALCDSDRGGRRLKDAAGGRRR